MNIKEIARLANVSVATVSRCINQPEKVASDTREVINAIIEQQGYSPNPSAQSLSTGMTKTVACVMPDLRNEFFIQLVEGCQAVLDKAGYRMLIYTTEKRSDFWNKFDERIIDGLVISGIAVQGDLSKRLSNITIPYVVIDHTDRLKKNSDISNVYVDDDSGIYKALDFLYRENNRRFGIICGEKSDTSSLAKRRIGTVTRFFDEHRDAVYQLEYGHYSKLDKSCEACERLLQNKDRPTAVVAFNDMIAAGALRCIQKYDLRIPEDIEIVGFDDIPLSAYFNPPLTTLRACNDRMGRTAAEILLEKLTEPQMAKHILFPAELILRESTKNIIDK